MAAKSSNFIVLDDEFAIDGAVTNENLQFLRENYQSLLYLCPDESNDYGAVDGFTSIRSVFSSEKSCYQIPIQVNEIQFQSNQSSSEYEYQLIRSYKRIEQVLDSLPRPTVVTCKSNRRASAIVAAYKAVKERLSTEEVFIYAKSKNFAFLTSDGLSSWVTNVLKLIPPLHSQIAVPSIVRKGIEYLHLPAGVLYFDIVQSADALSKEALLIDPVLETVERDSQLIKDLGLNLKYVLNTHVHADHTTGSGLLKQSHPLCRSAIAAVAGAKSDIALKEYDFVSIGNIRLFCLSTPGHTLGCTSFVLDDMTKTFTGDALLIRGCGRTDFQGGSAADLYASVHSRLLQVLPEECLVLPAHDYRGLTASSIGEEKRLNPRLTKPLAEFINIMDNLNLPNPKKLDESVTRNLNCGVF